MSLIININGLKETIGYLGDLKELYSNRQFIDFIKKKCLLAVKYQTDVRLSSLVDLNSALLSNYRNNHKIEDTTTGFILYNDLMNYEWLKYDFSIAEAVEYGIGVVGEGTGINASENNYLYDINNHGEMGWIYKNENGKTVWTKGYEGRNVYYYTYLEIMSKIDGWIDEFIESGLI